MESFWVKEVGRKLFLKFVSVGLFLEAWIGRRKTCQKHYLKSRSILKDGCSCLLMFCGVKSARFFLFGLGMLY